MASGYSPRWRRLLQKHTPFLFKVCPEGNYHWFWDKTCYCVANINGHKSYDLRKKEYNE